MRQDVPATHSAYYPPRAGTHARVRHAAGGLRRAAYAIRNRVPSFLSIFQTLAALVVPGLVFYRNGPRFVARWIWTGMGIALLVYLVGLGTFLGNLALGMLISAHVVSISHVIRPWLVRARMLFQVICGLAVFVVVTQLIYIPARGWFYGHVAMPLQVQGRTVVVNPNASASGITRGDWVAYRITATVNHEVTVHSGYGLGPVMALSGDRVQFGDGSLTINGQARPQPGCSASPDEMTMPDHTWLIWPEMRVSGHGGVPRSQIDAALRELAVVPQTEFVGRPYGRWFFRKQTTP